MFQIRNTLRLFTIIGIAPLAVLTFILPVRMETSGGIPSSFSGLLIAMVVFNFVWHLGWFLYFKRSRRVAVYFGPITSEDSAGVQEREYIGNLPVKFIKVIVIILLVCFILMVAGFILIKLAP